MYGDIMKQIETSTSPAPRTRQSYVNGEPEPEPLLWGTPPDRAPHTPHPALHCIAGLQIAIGAGKEQDNT